MFSSRKKIQNIVILVGVAFVAFVLGLLSGGLLDTSDAVLVGTAGLMDEDQACDTSVLNSSDPLGIVLADPLNFRIGPGLYYEITTTLGFCTSVSLEGRNADASWLLVKLEDSNLEGWVYSYYIQGNLDFDDLELKTGYGGPNTSGSTGEKSINVVIQYGNAAAFVTGMPANTETYAVLNPNSGYGPKSLAVASGYSDGDGNVTITFTMPTNWANGTKIESGKMTLTVTTGDVTQTAYLTFYTN